jgi:hypothetical protein
MNAIEFSGKIENGLIKLPLQYSQRFDNFEARILVLFNPKPDTLNQKKKLKELFAKAHTRNIFSEIVSPVQWQKQIRDEWE